MSSFDYLFLGISLPFLEREFETCTCAIQLTFDVSSFKHRNELLHCQSIIQKMKTSTTVILALPALS